MLALLFCVSISAVVKESQVLLKYVIYCFILWEKLIYAINLWKFIKSSKIIILTLLKWVSKHISARFNYLNLCCLYGELLWNVQLCWSVNETIWYGFTLIFVFDSDLLYMWWHYGKSIKSNRFLRSLKSKFCSYRENRKDFYFYFRYILCYSSLLLVI